MLVAAQVGDKEGAQGKHQRDCHVARKVGTARENHHQAKQVHHKDEEECREQVGSILWRLASHCGTYNAQIYELHQELEACCPAARSLHVVLLIPAHDAHHHQQHHKCRNQQRCHVLGYRQVERTILLALGIVAHKLVGIFAFFGNI